MLMWLVVGCCDLCKGTIMTKRQGWKLSKVHPLLAAGCTWWINADDRGRQSAETGGRSVHSLPTLQVAADGPFTSNLKRNTGFMIGGGECCVSVVM